MIEIRKQETAFDPYGEQEVLASAPEIFAIKRGQGQEQITSYTNVSNREITINNVVGRNVITDELISGNLILAPYGYAWVKKGLKL